MTPSENGPDMDLDERHDRATAGGEAVRTRPLSPGQHGIALQQRAAPGSPAFNVPAALRLTGPLDQEALRRSLTDVVARHDVLRSTFPVHDGESRTQAVHPARPVDLPVHDLRHLPAAERDRAASAILNAAAAVPFDLRAEPGLRCLLLTVADQEQIFFWMMHHIICDGWSKSLFAAELSQSYAAHRSGRPSPLTPLPATYGDFVTWQQDRDPAVLNAHLAYWQTQLHGVGDLPELPLTPHVRRPAATGGLGAGLELAVDAGTSRALGTLARHERATVFMVLHAALAAVIRHAGGQSDVIVNTPYGERPPDFESLIGFFVNVLPLRFRFTDAMTFRDLLRQTRATALDAYDHSQAPYHEVVRRLAQLHAGRIGPLPQLSLAFANLPYQDVELDGLRIERFPIDRVDIRYPLELHLWSDDEGVLAGRLLHRTDTIDARTAHDLARAYQDALRIVAAEPDLPIRDWGLPVPDLRPAPAPPTSVDAGQGAGPPALSATEETLYGIWADLLHTDDIEPDASFLHLGGHSLLVALMVAQVRETFAIELPVSVVYEDPTLKGVAAAIDTRT